MNETAEEATGDVHISLYIDSIGLYLDPGKDLRGTSSGGVAEFKIASSKWVREALSGRTTIELKRETRVLLDQLRTLYSSRNYDELIEELYGREVKKTPEVE